MMSTRSTLPMLAVLVMVLIFDTPRSAAQVSQYPATPLFTPPPPPLNTQPETPAGPTVQQPEPPPESLVWNSSRYPATDFRSVVTPPMFALWPENLSYVKFEYYCEDSNSTRKLEEFVYKEGQGYLVTRPYFDVGLVDERFTPYFRHWQFWQVNIRRITCVLHCEYSDLQRLYLYRLKRNVWGIGLGYGVTALVTLQVAVMVFTAPLRLCSKSTQPRTQIPSASTPKVWSKICDALSTWKSETPWSDCICDWIHLLLLVVIGFAMMEGVGHSDYFGWRSMLMYNTAVIYTYLTLFSMISSFLHQCSYFLTRRSFDSDPALPRNSITNTAAAAGAKSGLSEDWRYQRIFGQFGVLVLMSMYLIGLDDDAGQGMDSIGGIVLAAIVVACIWSAGVSAVVAARSVRDICKDWKSLARRVRGFFDSRTHAHPAPPQPASNVPPAGPVPPVSRSTTLKNRSSASVKPSVTP